jgi:hypothetical protein
MKTCGHRSQDDRQKSGERQTERIDASRTYFSQDFALLRCLFAIVSGLPTIVSQFDKKWVSSPYWRDTDS